MLLLVCYIAHDIRLVDDFPLLFATSADLLFSAANILLANDIKNFRFVARFSL